MPEVLEALAARKEAERAALEALRLARWRADAFLGRAILQERAKGSMQKVIAGRMGLTREQVRRYQVSYEEWKRAHGGSEPD
jgi:hypothetical protein